MEKNNAGAQHTAVKGGAEQDATKPTAELPTETSPYTQYTDLEDYKLQGYGVQGHLDPAPGRSAGATDAPTLSGGVSTATDAVNRQGVP